MSFASPVWLAASGADPGVRSPSRSPRAGARSGTRSAFRRSRRSQVAARRRTVVAALCPGRPACSRRSRRSRSRWPARRSATATSIRAASVMLVTDESGSMAATDVKPTPARGRRAGRQHVHRSASGAGARRRDRVLRRRRTPSRRRRSTTSAARALIDRQSRPTARPRPAMRSSSRFGCCTPARARHRRRGDRAALRRGGQRGRQRDHRRAPGRRARRSRSTPSRSARPSGTLPNPEPFGPPLAVPPDPQLMRQIAAVSHGREFDAQSADRLSSIYKGLGDSDRQRDPQARDHRGVRDRWACAAAAGRGRVDALVRAPSVASAPAMPCRSRRPTSMLTARSSEYCFYGGAGGLRQCCRPGPESRVRG